MRSKKKVRQKTNKEAGRLISAAVLLFSAVIFTGCGKEKAETTLSLEYALESNPAVAKTSCQDETSQEMILQPEEKQQTVFIYVCGAVNEPGVVELPDGCRAADAVREAGGMTEEADTAYVNLAARLQDGEKLFIPTVREAEALSQQQEAENAGVVNLNTADSTALCSLPGIGESRAADIIAYREQNGPFASKEDIMKVPGIKTGAYEKIKDKITV